MKNKPRIRFRGFTEDWEQRKLRNLLEQPITDGPHETPELYDSGIPFISVDAIVDNKIDFTKMRGYISKEYDDICAKKYKPQINDVYLVKSGATIGKVAIVDTYDDFNIWSPLAAMRCGSITNPYFLYMLLQTQDLQSQVFNKASHGTQPNLSMRQLETFTCKVPKIEEQKLISRFLKQLDDVITLHQRKLKKLKLAKKALLQKLFPKNGSQFPEIRFKGFTDAWEQCKFVDLLDLENGIRRGPFGSSLKKDSFVKKSDYAVYEQQNAIYDNYETRYFISREKYNELIRFNIQPGDFIMSGAGTIGRISMVPDGIKKGVFNQALIRFKVNKDSVDPLYFLKFMQSDMMQKQLTQANPGSAMTNLVPMDELKKWNIVIPSFEEQNRISTFIKQIDDVITLHQRKLDKLQEVKKGLLQKMFI